MKTVLKSLVVGLMVFALSFAPALAGIVQAGSINYEGFSSYKADRSYGYDEGTTRGIMFNFSFDGDKDYKETSSIQDVYKKNLTTNQKVGIGLGVVGIFVLLLIANDDDECVDGDTEIRPPREPVLSLFSPVVYASESRCRGDFQ